MKKLLLSFCAWATLAGGAAFLMEADQAIAFSAILGLPGLATALTLASRGFDAPQRPARIAWWIITLSAWGTLAVLMQGHWENPRATAEERRQLLLGSGLAVLVAAWMVFRLRVRLHLRTFAEIGAAAAVIALGLGGYYWQFEAGTRQLATEVEARWTQIGRPMDAFEKAFQAVPENETLSVLGEILLQQVNAGVYKRTDQFNADPQPTVPQEAIDVAFREFPLNDVLPADEIPRPILDARASQLDAAYTRILENESPRWAVDPKDGISMRPPNFLGLRMFAQLVAADATRRIQRGDIAGARRALAALRRATDGLLESPMLVSVMIHVAIDALASPKESRLPADPQEFAKLAADTVRVREALNHALQYEAWLLLRTDERKVTDWIPAADNGKPRLPAWLNRIGMGAKMRRDFHLSARANAEQVAILQERVLPSRGDMGSEALDRIHEAIPTPYAVNATRARIRVEATLLLREQTALLRHARERLAQGLPLESRESVVLPGRHWHFTADPARNTAALRLDEVPSWITTSGVTTAEFWLFPLDGSKPWQFSNIAKTAGRTNAR